MAVQKTQKKFSTIWSEISDRCRTHYGITVGNNARFVAETIHGMAGERDSLSYAECGVYKGTTFIPIYYLCKELFPRFSLYALDSFAGFPEETVLNRNDEFEAFESLHGAGRISEEHLERARERCSRLKKKEHIQQDYFGTYAEEFFRRAEGKNEIVIVKCSFGELASRFNHGLDRYDLVFLDCDLYLSYVQCLDFFKNRTDAFVFDEYYSHKYPGARIACDEFVEADQGWKFFSKREEDPYFERWGIRKETAT